MADEIFENIDRFNRITLALMNELYSAFPEPIDIDPNLLGITASGESFEGDHEEQRELAVAWMNSASSTINWLRNEGFIRSEEGSLEPEEVGVVLTSKGMQALGRTPRALIPRKKGKSLGESIKEFFKAGTKIAASEAVKELLDAGLEITLGG